MGKKKKSKKKGKRRLAVVEKWGLPFRRELRADTKRVGHVQHQQKRQKQVTAYRNASRTCTDNTDRRRLKGRCLTSGLALGFLRLARCRPANLPAVWYLSLAELPVRHANGECRTSCVVRCASSRYVLVEKSAVGQRCAQYSSRSKRRGWRGEARNGATSYLTSYRILHIQDTKYALHKNNKGGASKGWRMIWAGAASRF